MIKILGVLQGIISVEEFESGDAISKGKEIIRCKVSVEKNSRGYSSLGETGVDSKLFDQFKKEIDLMVNSYYYGYMLQTTDFAWITKKEIDERKEK